MRRQTLILLLGMLPLLAAAGVLLLVVRRGLREASGPRQEVRLGAVVLQLPAGFPEPLSRRKEGWEIREYRAGKLGTFLLSSEPAGDASFEDACRRWFHLPAYGAGPMNYRAGGAQCFFKEVPLPGRGAAALRKQGKRLRYVCFFEHSGMRHWIQMDTSQGWVPIKEVMDRILLSVRDDRGTAPGPDLAASLAKIPRESCYLFFLPLEAFVYGAGALFLLIAGILAWVRRRSGRRPDETTLRGVPSFLEPGVEIGLVRPFQRQYMDAAVVVDSHGLTLTTFGTPFLTVPRSALRGATRIGQGWFGPPYLELQLTGPLDFRKHAGKYAKSKGALTLRIYTQDATRLQVQLMG